MRLLASGCSARLRGLAAVPLIVFAVSNQLNIPERPTPEGRQKWLNYPPDQRAEKLAAFFRAYNCPKPHHVQDYIRAADAYHLDYRLLPAISLRETTCGVAERDNNRWGYHPGRQRFHSIPEGIDFLARQLSKNRPYAGKSLRDKLLTYNPLGTYPAEVERIMREIE